MPVPQEDNSTVTRRVGDYIGTMNTQGRVTLPEEVRDALDLHAQDKIVFRIGEGTIEIVGKLPSLTEMAGSITPLQPTLSIAETIHHVREEQSNKQFTRNPQP